MSCMVQCKHIAAGRPQLIILQIGDQKEQPVLQWVQFETKILKQLYQYIYILSNTDMDRKAFYLSLLSQDEQNSHSELHSQRAESLLSKQLNNRLNLSDRSASKCSNSNTSSLQPRTGNVQGRLGNVETRATNPQIRPLNGESRSKYGQERWAKSQMSYLDVCNFRSFQKTTRLMTYFSTFREFIETASKNVLFVFGPSGCGKRLLIEHSLTMSQISFEWARPKISQNQDGQDIHEDVYDMFYREMRKKSMTEEKVVVFGEFPLLQQSASPHHQLKHKLFRETLFQTISNSKNRNKYIFLLNSQIYSSYHTLSENSTERALTSLSNVALIKMEAYGKREMQAIIQHFLDQHPIYCSALPTPKHIDDVILQAEGDARKALNLIYYQKTIQQAKKQSQASRHGLFGSDNSQRPKAQLKRQYEPQEEETAQKISIFHMLGKFLYAKRMNINYNPNLKKKKGNEISAYYTEQEIIKYNPKFYFRPVATLDRSRVPFTVFEELLEQNFLLRYGKIKDIAKMYSLFRYCDSYLQDSTNRYFIKRQMEQNIKQLISWGIILYNRNSVRPSFMVPITKSKNKLNLKTLEKKLNILKSHYLKQDLSTKGYIYRIKDVLYFAFLTKNDRYRNDYAFMHQKLIQVVFDTRKSIKLQESMDMEANVILEDEEEERAAQGCERMNQIEKMITVEIRKKKLIMELLQKDAESDGQDIDSN